MTLPADVAPSLWGVLALGVIASVTLAAFRVPKAWSPGAAILRGAVQLAAISVVLSGIITSAFWIAVALVVMFISASCVAIGRVGWSSHAAVAITSSIAAGIGTALVVVFGTGALALTPRYVLAMGAIVIGNAMSVAALTGRNFTTSVIDHWDEVEGWLAIGARPRESTIHLARRSVRDALIPAIDQTRTTGLVVLPGAFVGAIFGGISPVEAGRFQIVVLAAIMAAGAVTAVLIAVWMGNIARRPTPVR